MTFGQPGRPPEDRLIRQREIYERVAPLILTDGARRLQMRDAAHAACMSIGGLYYYFPSKRELVLHGLDPAARSRICADQEERLRASESTTFADICIDTTLHIIEFMRPSVAAARDLGGDILHENLDPGWTSQVDDLAARFQMLLPGESPELLTTLARLIRRVMIGALVERDVDLQVVRKDLSCLIESHVGHVHIA